MATKRKPAVVRRLSIDLALLVTGVCLVFLGIYAYRDDRSNHALAESYVLRNADRALKEYHDLFEGPIKSDLNRIREWGSSGLLAAKDPQILDKIFKPILTENALIHRLDLVDTSGFHYGLIRHGEDWETHFSKKDSTKQYAQNDTLEALQNYEAKEGIEGSSARFGTPMVDLSADPGQDHIHWGALYVNASLGEEAISATVRWVDPELGERAVSLEILASDLFDRIEGLSAEVPGAAFMFNQDKEVLMPADGKMQDDSTISVLVPFEKLSDPILKSALAVIDLQRDSAAAQRSRVDKQVLWSAFRSLDPQESPIWLGFAVLESELVNAIDSGGVDLLYIGIAILFIAILIGWIIVRKYRFQLKDLPGKSLKPNSTEAELRELIDKDESATLEFKSTMRKNLRSGKKDKAIEIAFLKGIVGFMNTDGGTLLIGVNDDGEIVGTEEDEFENDDKCRLHFKNLFRQHIGMEFSKYVEFFFMRSEGRSINVIVCQRAKNAVFLKHDGKEIFYIRNGPASEELAPSKVLERVRRR